MISEASTVATATLRTVYSAKQFAVEVLQGNRTPAWVAEQCSYGKIKTVGRRPWLIPMREAQRFIDGPR